MPASAISGNDFSTLVCTGILTPFVPILQRLVLLHRIFVEVKLSMRAQTKPTILVALSPSLADPLARRVESFLYRRPCSLQRALAFVKGFRIGGRSRGSDP